MTLGKNKILTNVEMTENWKYDLTPTLTQNVDGFMPYMFLMGQT